MPRLLVFAAAFAVVSVASAQTAERAVGTWKAEEAYFRATIQIEPGADGGLAAFFLGEDGSRGARLSAAVVRGDSLFLAADAVGASFRGAVGDGRIVGTWAQEGMTVALTLVPSRPADTDRQRAEPAPYASQEVAFDNGRVRLAATLTVPEGPGPHPAVVLVPGTGDNDRDYATMGDAPFRVIADHLTRRGIAVLRYDERGVGGSGGNALAARLDDETRDVAEAVRYLRGRIEIDAERVGVVGHSVGGVVGPAVHERLERAAFVVLLMAPAVPLGDLLRAQSPRMAAAAGATPAEVERERVLGAAVLDAAAAETDSLTAAAAMAAAFDAAGWPPEARDAAVRANTSAGYRDLARADPRPALARLDVPVLAVYGRADLAVTPAENAAPMLAALTASPDVTVVVLDDLGHDLRQSGDDSAVDPRLLALLAEWVGARE